MSVDQHNLSHHGQDETKIAQLKRVEIEIVRAFGDLLTDLQARGDASGSLLDKTAVLFGSNLGNANAHTPVDLRSSSPAAASPTGSTSCTRASTTRRCAICS